MDSVIEIEELTFNYSDEIIFYNMNLVIPKYSFTTILGPNGSGKTTLLKLLTGKINANTFIMIEDSPIIKENFELVEKDISYIPEKIKIDNKNQTLEESLLNYSNSINQRISQKKITEILKELNLDSKQEKKLISLNTQEKTLLEFAKILIKKPKIIIMDSTLEKLNKKNKKNILKILYKFQKNKITIINATNNTEDSLLGNFVGIIADKNIYYGPKEYILSNVQLFNYSNLSLPFIIDLSNKLQLYELINRTYIDTEKLVDDLWT